MKVQPAFIFISEFYNNFTSDDQKKSNNLFTSDQYLNFDELNEDSEATASNKSCERGMTLKSKQVFSPLRARNPKGTMKHNSISLSKMKMMNFSNIKSEKDLKLPSILQPEPVKEKSQASAEELNETRSLVEESSTEKKPRKPALRKFQNPK